MELPVTMAFSWLQRAVTPTTGPSDEVKAGTATDTRIRLRGKGVPAVNNPKRRGDHYVTLVVQVPTKMNRAQKEALKKYAEAMGESV